MNEHAEQAARQLLASIYDITCEQVTVDWGNHSIDLSYPYCKTPSLTRNGERWAVTLRDDPSQVVNRMYNLYTHTVKDEMEEQGFYFEGRQRVTLTVNEPNGLVWNKLVREHPGSNAIMTYRWKFGEALEPFIRSLAAIQCDPLLQSIAMQNKQATDCTIFIDTLHMPNAGLAASALSN